MSARVRTDPSTCSPKLVTVQTLLYHCCPSGTTATLTFSSLFLPRFTPCDSCPSLLSTILLRSGLYPDGLSKQLFHVCEQIKVLTCCSGRKHCLTNSLPRWSSSSCLQNFIFAPVVSAWLTQFSKDSTSVTLAWPQKKKKKKKDERKQAQSLKFFCSICALGIIYH